MGFGQYSYNSRPSKPDFSSGIPAPKKRVRHVFDNPAHVWAHPRQKDGSGFEQDNARVAGGNWYFKTSPDGARVVYSYRDSYPIASRFQHGKKIIFLLRSGKPYSVTTSGHMNGTRSAVPKDDKNVQVFTVPVMVNRYDHTKPRQEELEANLLFYVAEITDAIERYTKARSSYNITGTLNEATDLTAEAKRYAGVFKLKLPELPKLPVIDKAKLAAIVKREQEREGKAGAKRAAERAKWEAQHKAEVEAWQNGPDACKHLGTDGKPAHSFQDRWSCQTQREQEEWEATKADKITAWKRGEDVRLRIQYSEPALLRVKDGNVETSMHVSVPVSGQAGAARLWRFLKALKDHGRTYVQNGHTEHIGNFTVTSFDGQLMTAGCHRITWGEIVSISDAVLAAEVA